MKTFTDALDQLVSSNPDMSERRENWESER